MTDQALRSGANSPPIRTLVPGERAIELVAYYLQQSDYYPECELKTKRWFVENVRPEWVIFDVGANIGYYSILFSRLAPAGKVFAFEPTETFSMLRENLGYHGCRNVNALQIAVGMVSGAVKDDIFRIWGAEPERLTYNFSTVDDLVEKLKLTRLDCIKIDVDSFDFEVLMGAQETLRRLNPWIVVELCHALSRRNQSAPQALEWLACRGYRKAHVLEHENYVLHRDPDDRPQHDEKSMLLTFESRPIILPPQWINGAPLENLFGSPPLAHNDARLSEESDGRVLITVPGPRWAYACSWPRRDDRHFDQPILLQLKIQVAGASVGLGCVSEDFAEYVSKEINVNPGSDTQTVTLYVENSAAVKHLVLRNVDLVARQAVVVINELYCFAAAKNTLN